MIALDGQCIRLTDWALDRPTASQASVVRHTPVDEAKRWASGKGRKVGFAKARATFRGGGTGIAATAAKHDSLIKKARWRGTEQIARETPAGSVSVVTMPHRKDFASDKEHQVKFNLWLKTDGFKGKVRNGAVREPEHLARAHACVDPCRSGSSRWPRSTRSRVLTCLLYTSPSPRDRTRSRMPSSA